MSKYIIGIILILAVAFYFFNTEGALLALIGLAGVGSNKFSKKQKELESKADSLKEEIKQLEKDEKVKDLTPEEEEDYWSKQ